MIKLSHTAMIVISGLVWLAVGLFLLPVGLHLLVRSAEGVSVPSEVSFPLLRLLTPYFGSAQQATLLLVVLGLCLGYIKGKYVLSKSVQRSIRRIQTFPNPTSIIRLYSRGYLLLLVLMIGLGVSIKFFGVPEDIRGFIDTAVGAALVNGSMLYFRSAATSRTFPVENHK